MVGTQPIVSSAVWWLMYQLQIHSITLWHRIFKNSVTFFPCISRRKRKEKKRKEKKSLSFPFSPNFWGIRQLLSSKYQFNQLSCLVAIWRPYIWCLIMEGFYDLLLSCSLDVYTSVFFFMGCIPYRMWGHSTNGLWFRNIFEKKIVFLN